MGCMLFCYDGLHAMNELQAINELHLPLLLEDFSRRSIAVNGRRRLKRRPARLGYLGLLLLSSWWKGQGKSGGLGQGKSGQVRASF